MISTATTQQQPEITSTTGTAENNDVIINSSSNNNSTKITSSVVEGQNTLKSLIIDSWRQRLSPFEWSLKIDKSFHLKSENKLMKDDDIESELCDILLKQMYIGKIPSPLLVSYLRYAISIKLIGYTEFFQSVFKYSSPSKPQHFSVILDIVLDIMNIIVDSPTTQATNNIIHSNQFYFQPTIKQDQAYSNLISKHIFTPTINNNNNSNSKDEQQQQQQQEYINGIEDEYSTPTSNTQKRKRKSSSSSSIPLTTKSTTSTINSNSRKKNELNEQQQFQKHLKNTSYHRYLLSYTKLSTLLFNAIEYEFQQQSNNNSNSSGSGIDKQQPIKSIFYENAIKSLEILHILLNNSKIKSYIYLSKYEFTLDDFKELLDSFLLVHKSIIDWYHIDNPPKLQPQQQQQQQEFDLSQQDISTQQSLQQPQQQEKKQQPCQLYIVIQKKYKPLIMEFKKILVTQKPLLPIQEIAPLAHRNAHSEHQLILAIQLILEEEFNGNHFKCSNTYTAPCLSSLSDSVSIYHNIPDCFYKLQTLQSIKQMSDFEFFFELVKTIFQKLSFTESSSSEYKRIKLFLLFKIPQFYAIYYHQKINIKTNNNNNSNSNSNNNNNNSNNSSSDSNKTSSSSSGGVGSTESTTETTTTTATTETTSTTSTNPTSSNGNHKNSSNSSSSKLLKSSTNGTNNNTTTSNATASKPTHRPLMEHVLYQISKFPQISSSQDSTILSLIQILLKKDLVNANLLKHLFPSFSTDIESVDSEIQCPPSTNLSFDNLNSGTGIHSQSDILKIKELFESLVDSDDPNHVTLMYDLLNVVKYHLIYPFDYQDQLLVVLFNILDSIDFIKNKTLIMVLTFIFSDPMVIDCLDAHGYLLKLVLKLFDICELFGTIKNDPDIHFYFTVPYNLLYHLLFNIYNVKSKTYNLDLLKSKLELYDSTTSPTNTIKWLCDMIKDQNIHVSNDIAQETFDFIKALLDSQNEGTEKLQSFALKKYSPWEMIQKLPTTLFVIFNSFDQNLIEKDKVINYCSLLFQSIPYSPISIFHYVLTTQSHQQNQQHNQQQQPQSTTTLSLVEDLASYLSNLNESLSIFRFSGGMKEDQMNEHLGNVKILIELFSPIFETLNFIMFPLLNRIYYGNGIQSVLFNRYSLSYISPPIELFSMSPSSAIHEIIERFLNQTTPNFHNLPRDLKYVLSQINTYQAVNLVTKEILDILLISNSIDSPYSMRAMELGGYILGNCIGIESLPIFFNSIIPIWSENISTSFQGQLLAYFGLCIVLFSDTLFYIDQQEQSVVKTFQLFLSLLKDTNIRMVSFYPLNGLIGFCVTFVSLLIHLTDISSKTLHPEVLQAIQKLYHNDININNNNNSNSNIKLNKKNNSDNDNNNDKNDNNDNNGDGNNNDNNSPNSTVDNNNNKNNNNNENNSPTLTDDESMDTNNQQQSIESKQDQSDKSQQQQSKSNIEKVTASYDSKYLFSKSIFNQLDIHQLEDLAKSILGLSKNYFLATSIFDKNDLQYCPNLFK